MEYFFKYALYFYNQKPSRFSLVGLNFKMSNIVLNLAKTRFFLVQYKYNICQCWAKFLNCTKYRSLGSCTLYIPVQVRTGTSTGTCLLPDTS